MNQVQPYKPQHKVRIVTAASLFDGHDAAINIMRRIMQSTGAEVIHLGHNRSVQEIVDCAIQEDVQGIAITSYQGGHVEFFKYMHDLLKEKGAGHIKIFGGGGGTILPTEIEDLHQYGIDRIYSPDDGRAMGLQGMINDVISKCDYANNNGIHPESVANLPKKDPTLVGRVISIVENVPEMAPAFMEAVEKHQPKKAIPVLGITGTGGAGKSSLTDELVRRFLLDFEDKTVAVLSVDPTKRRTGGALLGDRIRMNAIFHERVYMRSMATRQANLSMSQTVDEAIKIFRAAQYDLIIV
ncbi:MAG: cobalamin-dependent protein, partial [Bacteroidota bacterium]